MNHFNRRALRKILCVDNLLLLLFFLFYIFEQLTPHVLPQIHHGKNVQRFCCAIKPCRGLLSPSTFEEGGYASGYGPTFQMSETVICLITISIN